ncbi:BLUF domain-containing protein [Breoghania sp.]|uniref:BLUF domain-containing protein n=1 Tax=Breoghania sp. TaxID=2065378 RepID=UPI0026386495|nr:BLUF domain-containing protein [Breoghania sp.]MDJ0931362.1 BLUF domain-containing protein [Breoghania sp.]
MSLYQICYRSRIKPDVLSQDPEDAIAQTTHRLRRMNALNGVTGALIFTDTHVFQLIEGQAERATASLECAVADPRHERHEDVEILSRKAAEYRLFHDSWLYFADLRMDHGRELPSQLAMIMPRPETATAADVLALMAYIAGDLAEAHLTNRILQI